MKSIINLWMILQNLNIINPKKSQVVFLQTPPQKIIRYAKSLKDIVVFYKPQLGNVMSKKGEGLKILTNKQMLNHLPILLAKIEAGNNPNKLKNETRQILYSLYRSKALTKTVCNKLIKSICALGSAVHFKELDFVMSTTFIKMETFFMNAKNSKTNESHRFKYDLIDKLDLKNPNKNMALGSLSIYYTWKNVKSTYNNNKFKISAPTWNETFDLPD